MDCNTENNESNEDDIDSLEKKAEKWMSTYFKRGEVALRNTTEECWVVIRRIVRDLTPLVQRYITKSYVRPILAEAGKDISHWFNDQGELLTFVHPITMELVPYLPHGNIPHLCENYLPSPYWFPTPLVPWWKDKRYFIGRLTANERPIRVRNMLTKMEATFTVCEEDTIGGGIADRYKVYNSAYNSYVWKFEGKKVKMNKTLTDNGIEDIRPAMRDVQIPECFYIPCLDLYYKDDFLCN
ncbi:cytochrome b5 domain-containing protein 1 [Halyomorpha halys]|uniref:cytochrome b5 domain-containing protein 1 n=1 Tax=Halyomorpha halys TaxID=286706 RepID=UPI0006D51CCB|nr:cytochrome b5 domain-containing protein 1 [Halyomorpha halys]